MSENTAPTHVFRDTASPPVTSKTVAREVIMFNLDNYLENHVARLYDNHDPAHGVSHIRDVAARALHIADNIPNPPRLDMLLTAVWFHDTGLAHNGPWHHVISAYLLRQDAQLPLKFLRKEIWEMSDAIETHRSSNTTKPRSILGMVLADADRDVDVEKIILRFAQVVFMEARVWKTTHTKYASDFWVGLDATSGQITDAQIAKETQIRFVQKYGKGGRGRSTWLGLPEQEQGLARIRAVAESPAEFDRWFEKVKPQLADIG